jgi:hypothetical protein
MTWTALPVTSAGRFSPLDVGFSWPVASVERRSPSVQPHYRAFIPTTGHSAPVLRIGTRVHRRFPGRQGSAPQQCHSWHTSQRPGIAWRQISSLARVCSNQGCPSTRLRAMPGGSRLISRQPARCETRGHTDDPQAPFAQTAAGKFYRARMSLTCAGAHAGHERRQTGS